ncbi:MAG: hypothetical protein IJM19_01110 [Ruminococcus sp.]|nr:hypothetical protein [Ruminococcus sp.]
MNKKYFPLISAIFILMTGCQSKTETVVSSEVKNSTEPIIVAAEYPITLKVGYSTGQDDPGGIALDSFKETVEKQTNGDILIEIHPSGELGSDSELLAGMIDGSVDMTVSSAGNYALYTTRVGYSHN